jgi:2'-5' RNA ligase
MITYLLSLPIDLNTVGTAYERLPLHCTLLPLFEVPEDTNMLARHLSEIVKCHDPIKLEPWKPSLFGPNEDVPVIRVRSNAALKELHRQVMECLIKSGAKLVQPKWSGRGYKPHVSNLPDRTFAGQKTAIVKKVLLIRKYPTSYYVAASMDLRKQE